ncbi:CHAD domain-containing protein [Novosphingobium mangrovi (ex Huang et al. 2023)]|uniref:CHAD domain-containing protein n=1 Tax=Novosphingobium mangrovi (ex Huang et al. 2023) TaxID=2976432 RepID=A0ABT2I2M0_9SPHN|nr:CHAD domain-containing protein [Novosphingobium mangrovi (ex Huang et al. 2023)]MCT2399052.1 CHAD domain-containing protein [Novosphingobium mangrovi (ex Huang et al. 2023)]
MAYRFRAGDRSVERAVRRIAREQIDGALSAIDTQGGDVATHEVRKACKKIRALVRLVRPGFAGYARENTEFREIAGLLAGARDAKVLLDTFDLLMTDAPDPGPFVPLREQIAPEATGALQGETGADRLGQARALLKAARKRVDNWTLEGADRDVLGAGLGKVLRKARGAARTVENEPSALHYHELRKLMKYHWYHVRLMMPIWPEMMRPLAGELSRLADMLGLHHDVCVLEERLGSLPPGSAHAGAGQALLKLAGRRRVRLERQIAPLSARLLAQPVDAVVDHWQALWRIWRAGCAEARGKRQGG